MTPGNIEPRIVDHTINVDISLHSDKKPLFGPSSIESSNFFPPKNALHTTVCYIFRNAGDSSRNRRVSDTTFNAVFPAIGDTLHIRRRTIGVFI